MNDPSNDQPMMRAAVIDAFGPPEVLRTRFVPVPKIAQDEVLLRVEAAGVNAID
jgi:NADPH:quinone reductase-like Zn-dependent oxidoreductase